MTRQSITDDRHVDSRYTAPPPPDEYDGALEFDNPGDGEMRFRSFTIAWEPHSWGPERPWSFVGDDYDGAPDGNRHLCGHAATIGEAMKEIDILVEDELPGNKYPDEDYR